MKKLVIATAAAAFVLGAYSANAQQKAPEKAPAAKATEKAPVVKKAPSPCKGLDETACVAKSECQWIVPKTGKQKPYCKLKSTPKKKASKDTAPAKDAAPKK